MVSEASPNAHAGSGDQSPSIRLRGEIQGAGVEEVLTTLDRELVGLRPVKTRIREIASLLVV